MQLFVFVVLGSRHNSSVPFFVATSAHSQLLSRLPQKLAMASGHRDTWLFWFFKNISVFAWSAFGVVNLLHTLSRFCQGRSTLFLPSGGIKKQHFCKEVVWANSSGGFLFTNTLADENEKLFNTLLMIPA
jgi:hypothetical protein